LRDQRIILSRTTLANRRDVRVVQRDHIEADYANLLPFGEVSPVRAERGVGVQRSDLVFALARYLSIVPITAACCCANAMADPSVTTSSAVFIGFPGGS